MMGAPVSGMTDSAGDSSLRGKPMKEPGLDDRHRNKKKPKAGQIGQKHGNTLNKNLPSPIPEFPPTTTLSEMREATGKTSEAGVRRAAKRLPH